MRFSQGIKNMHHFAENALNSVFTTYSRHPTSISPPHTKKALYVNKASSLKLYSHKDPFYTHRECGMLRTNLICSHIVSFDDIIHLFLHVILTFEKIFIYINNNFKC